MDGIPVDTNHIMEALKKPSRASAPVGNSIRPRTTGINSHYGATKRRQQSIIKICTLNPMLAKTLCTFAHIRFGISYFLLTFNFMCILKNFAAISCCCCCVAPFYLFLLCHQIFGDFGAGTTKTKRENTQTKIKLKMLVFFRWWYSLDGRSFVTKWRATQNR